MARLADKLQFTVAYLRPFIS